MSLRMRLSLAFVFVVLAPLVIAAVLVARGVPESSTGQASARAEAAANAAATLLAEQCSAAQLVARGAAWQAATTSAGAAVHDAVVARPSASGSLYAAVVTPSGEVVASAGQLPPLAAQQLAGGSPLGLGTCTRGSESSPYVIAAQVPVRLSTGAAQRTVVVALALDRHVMTELGGAAGTDVTLVTGSTVVASTLPAGEAADAAQRAERALAVGHSLRAGGYLLDAVPPGPGRSVTVLARVRQGRDGTGLAQELAAVVAAALVLAAAIGWLLARMTTRPLVELATAAERVASGNLDTRIPVTSGDEVGQLAVAFNEMTGDLRTYIEALQRSRDELRGNLARLGDTLSGTHDLGRILTVILETAMGSVRARGGALLMGAAGRSELYVRVSRGVDDLAPGARVRVGDGVLGMVAGSGEAVRGRIDESGHLVTPGATGGSVAGGRSVLAVPLKRSGRVLGVLGLYEPVDAAEFDETDLETIRTFSAQATVAIDNVLLHQEAQRMSITDGLTGLWNYRYFTMNFAKEIERAARFHRPLALLLLDLDKFKDVNDAHGHQRGDSVLIELATRVSAEIREVDTFARYGGEEFVLVLPETDAAGAGQAAERVCQVVRHRAFGHQGEEPLRVTVSVGVAVFPEHGTTAAGLIRAADTALYAAKGAGRDGWRIASDLEVAAGRGD